MFYGAWLDDSKQLKELRYQGRETPRDNVPNSGIATYYGKAVRVDNHPLGGGVQILTEDTTSRINVNFGTKTVNGEITMPGLRRDITLHDGPLSGASYSGRASVLGMTAVVMKVNCLVRMPKKPQDWLNSIQTAI